MDERQHEKPVLDYGRSPSRYGCLVLGLAKMFAGVICLGIGLSLCWVTALATAHVSTLRTAHPIFDPFITFALLAFVTLGVISGSRSLIRDGWRELRY